MGHTLADWTDRVGLWLADVGQLDVLQPMIETLAIPAALTQYGVDRGAAATVAELPGNGTSYYAVPGFDPSTGSILAVEYPARQNPPRMLDGSLWGVGRDPADVTLTRLVLYAAQPTAAQFLRVTFASSGPLPFPTSTASADLVPDAMFPFVTALAAAYCCLQLLSEASRDRQGAIPTDFADGSQRALMLQQTADRLTNVYRMALGLPPVGAAGGVPTSPSGPAFGRFTVSSGGGTLFHRGP